MLTPEPELHGEGHKPLLNFHLFFFPLVHHFLTTNHTAGLLWLALRAITPHLDSHFLPARTLKAHVGIFGPAQERLKAVKCFCWIYLWFYKLP